MNPSTTPLKMILQASGESAKPRLLVATHNAGKLREFERLLVGTPFTDVVGGADAGLIAPVEDSGTFEGNAMIKARAAMSVWDDWVLADDSGLCVDALRGAPGVESAHFGGWEKLLDVMRDVPKPKRTAHFVAVLVLGHHRHGTWVFRAERRGAIALEGRGNSGFGFDPVFIPDGKNGQTFAELGDAAKAELSHRAAAVAMLRKAVDCG